MQICSDSDLSRESHWQRLPTVTFHLTAAPNNSKKTFIVFTDLVSVNLLLALQYNETSARSPREVEWLTKKMTI